MYSGIRFKKSKSELTGQTEMWATWFPRKQQTSVTAVYVYNREITDDESAKARLTWKMYDAVSEVFGDSE